MVALNGGRYLAEVARRVRSSISRLYKHRMVPHDVRDAQYPVPRQSDAPEIDYNGRRHAQREIELDARGESG